MLILSSQLDFLPSQKKLKSAKLCFIYSLDTIGGLKQQILKCVLNAIINSPSAIRIGKPLD